jgi:hypothetical protein
MDRVANALLVSLLAAACGIEPDTRPETLDYVVEAILAPDCGRGGCHSSDTRAHDLEFDTIAAASAALQTRQRNQMMVVPGSPTTSFLVTVLTDSQSPMPPDVPLPNADIALITAWIADGAAGFP